MAKKASRPKPLRRSRDRRRPARSPAKPAERQSESPRVYEHPEEKLLLRPDVGLQAQFRSKKPPKKYRYDPSLDPALSWDIGADRERAEALIARIEQASDLAEARTAAAQLRRMSRPFLNWAGQAERTELSVPTLPLFVHERLSTQAILQSVRSHKRDRQLSLSLFADEELDIADRILKAYEHETPWVNRLILGDSLVVMNSLLEYEGLGGQVQMIYMDPPYGVRFGSNFQPFLRRRDSRSPRDVRHGDDEDMTREPEMVQAYRDTWELGLHSYLTYLRDRLLLCRELLAPKGSIFVQINDENLHHVREVMDEVFGAECFIVTILIKKKGSQKSSLIDPVNDCLLWYGRTAREEGRLRFHPLFERMELDGETLAEFRWVELADGREFPISALPDPEGAPRDYRLSPRRIFRDHPGARLFRPWPITNGGTRANQMDPIVIDGMTFLPPRGRCWSHASRTSDGSLPGMERLKQAARLVASGKSLDFKRYLDDFPYKAVSNWWDALGGASSPIYVVQTNAEIVQRCVLMTSDPGDLVFDPTCGSGTTPYVSERWGRRWIAIDTSRVPLALARQRLLTATYSWYQLRDPARGPRGGFVYERRQNARGGDVGGIVPHITSSTLAGDAPPVEEVLVDRPEPERGIVRVTGPFVVEATIPTALGVEPEPTTGERQGAYDAAPIERMIEVLRRSPSLRLRGGEAVMLRNIRRPARALALHAEAEMVERTVADLAEEAATQRPLDKRQGRPVALVFGPEHGPVTEQMVYAAAREANVKGYAHLFVVGFAIQAGASKLIQNAEEAVGVPATYVQATMDLLMDDLLKTTRSSQIFAVTGAPDVRLVRLKKVAGNGPLYRVELRGLDVFDPVTMENAHVKGEDVPAWFLDSDYDDLVFHVTQAFFPKTGAWENLRRALRATYADAVWEHLAGAVSERFAAGEFRRVAVKVIDERGNELMTVLGLDEAEPER